MLNLSLWAGKKINDLTYPLSGVIQGYRSICLTFHSWLQLLYAKWHWINIWIKLQLHASIDQSRCSFNCCQPKPSPLILFYPNRRLCEIVMISMILESWKKIILWGQSDRWPPTSNQSILEYKWMFMPNVIEVVLPQLSRSGMAACSGEIPFTGSLPSAGWSRLVRSSVMCERTFIRRRQTPSCRYVVGVCGAT